MLELGQQAFAQVARGHADRVELLHQANGFAQVFTAELQDRRHSVAPFRRHGLRRGLMRNHKLKVGWLRRALLFGGRPGCFRRRSFVRRGFRRHSPFFRPRLRHAHQLIF